MHCRMSWGIPDHYPLDTSRWGGGFPNPSVSTKCITRLVNVPWGWGGRRTTALQ